MGLLDLYHQIKNKYPSFIFGYSEHGDIIQMSVLSRRGKAKFAKLDAGKPIQTYANIWLGMLKELQ